MKGAHSCMLVRGSRASMLACFFVHPRVDGSCISGGGGGRGGEIEKEGGGG